MIYYTQPYSTDKNIGNYYNRFMELLPEEDDIACFLDGDAMFLTENYGHQLSRIASKYKDCGCFVGMTNRVGCQWQRVFSPGKAHWDNHDISFHRTIASELQGSYYDAVEDISKVPRDAVFGGVMFMVRKWLWKKAGRFKEDGMLGVDNDFHWKIMDSNERIMLMKGVYVYHWYRGKDGKRDHLAKKTVKTAAYTAVFGEYETIKRPLCLDESIDFFLFTDEEGEFPRLHVFNEEKEELDKVGNARYFKIMGWMDHFREYEVNLWMDGSFQARPYLTDFIGLLDEETDMVLVRHPDTDCIYKEALKCFEFGRGDPEEIGKQILKYKKDGYPRNNGLIASGILLRRNNNIVAELMKRWWREIVRHSTRDQISFSYALWSMKKKPSIKYIGWQDLFGFFEFYKHDRLVK